MDQATELRMNERGWPADLVDQAWQDGERLLLAETATAEWLAGQANTSLTVLAGVIAAALAWGAPVMAWHAPPQAWGALAVCVWASALAAWLVRRCHMVDGIPHAYHAPAHWLYDRAVGLEQFKRLDLAVQQRSLERAGARNARCAWHLNAVRMAALAMPIVFAVAAAAARRFTGSGG